MLLGRRNRKMHELPTCGGRERDPCQGDGSGFGEMQRAAKVDHCLPQAALRCPAGWSLLVLVLGAAPARPPSRSAPVLVPRVPRPSEPGGCVEKMLGRAWSPPSDAGPILVHRTSRIHDVFDSGVAKVLRNKCFPYFGMEKYFK